MHAVPPLVDVSYLNTPIPWASVCAIQIWAVYQVAMRRRASIGRISLGEDWGQKKESLTMRVQQRAFAG